MKLDFENSPPDVSILANDVWCGTIDAPTPAFPGWRIRLMVTGPDFRGSPYHWLTMRRIYEDEHQAKASLESMWPALQRNYEIWRESE